MMNALKRYYFQREFKKVRADINGDNSSTNGLESVLILTDGSFYKEDEVSQSIREFEARGLAAAAYLLSNHIPTKEIKGINYITKETLYWSGVPKQELLVEWLHDRYDLLISINPSMNATISYLTACSNNLLKSSIIFNEQMERNIHFYWQIEKNGSASLADHCLALYDNLINIFGK